MRTLSIILLFCLVATLSGDGASRRRGILMSKPVATGSSGQAFSDDFNRADSTSLGSNWTEEDGTWEIVSNALVCNEGSFNKQVAIYSGQACDGISQYVKFTYADSGVRVPGVVFRFTDAASEFYLIRLDDNNNVANFWHYASIGGTGTQIGGNSAITIAGGETFGMTIDGTGDDVEIRIWTNPTGLPDAYNDWNGDTTPDVTITSNPGANNVDSGGYVGLWGEQTTTALDFDDFFGGDNP